MNEERAKELLSGLKRFEWGRKFMLDGEYGFYIGYFDVLSLLMEHSRGDEWISVKERLPELGVAVLTYWFGVFHIQQMYVDARSEAVEWTGIPPTHWQPLPTPPAIEKGNE